MIHSCPERIRSFFHAQVLIFTLLLLTATTVAQSKIEYEISFPNAAHHEAEIVVTINNAPANKPFEMRMSRSSPGRYAAHEFARNVYNVKATDDKGAPLVITRPNAHQWNINGHRGKVRVSYTLFGDLGSGTYTGIDNTMAHLDVIVTTHKTIDLVFSTQVFKLKREMRKSSGATASLLPLRHNPMTEVTDETPADSSTTVCGRPAPTGTAAAGTQAHS